MKPLRLDPRTKLFLILLCVLSAMFAPSLYFQLALVALIGLLAALCGKWQYALRGLLIYALICGFTVWCMESLAGTWRTMFIAFLGLVHKVYACGLLAGIVISTTKVGEFLSAMARLRCPKKLTIPLAVMLRYLPTIREDWHFIKDAMRLRDVSPTLWGFLKAPAMTVDCIYVPQSQLRLRIAQTARALHIEDLLDRSIFALSGGEKQKITFASVYAMEPEIYLLDEPSSNLDISSIGALREHLKLIKSQGKTVVIAQHRLYYLMDVADRILCLENGRIAGDWTPAQFRRIPAERRQEMGLRAIDLTEERPIRPALPAAAPVLELKNVTLAYQKQTVLRNICLQAAPGRRAGQGLRRAEKHSHGAGGQHGADAGPCNPGNEQQRGRRPGDAPVSVYTRLAYGAGLSGHAAHGTCFLHADDAGI